eukprot:IDg6189t1
MRTNLHRLRAVAAQEELVDRYLLSEASEYRFLSVEVAQNHYLRLSAWFKRRWWYSRDLVVGFVPYAHYMSEAMLAPSVQDRQMFLREYLVVTAPAW